MPAAGFSFHFALVTYHFGLSLDVGEKGHQAPYFMLRDRTFQQKVSMRSARQANAGVAREF